MKKFIALMTLGLSLNLFAAATTPMNAVEETSHIIDKYAKAGKIDASFLTNVTTVTVQAISTGLQTVAYAPSANSSQANTVTISFDLQGRVKTVAQNFISAYPQGPIFIAADSATLFDLGSEAVVDHLADNADLPVVAKNASTVQLTAGANSVVMKIQLTSGKVYNITMDQNGKVLSQGF
ncbi:MAG: hypothetical protein ACXVLQ_05105 [Bacteriovorax sp.]